MSKGLGGREGGHVSKGQCGKEGGHMSKGQGGREGGKGSKRKSSKKKQQEEQGVPHRCKRWRWAPRRRSAQSVMAVELVWCMGLATTGTKRSGGQSSLPVCAVAFSRPRKDSKVARLQS